MWRGCLLRAQLWMCVRLRTKLWMCVPLRAQLWLQRLLRMSSPLQGSLLRQRLLLPRPLLLRPSPQHAEVLPSDLL